MYFNSNSAPCLCYIDYTENDSKLVYISVDVVCRKQNICLTWVSRESRKLTECKQCEKKTFLKIFITGKPSVVVGTKSGYFVGNTCTKKQIRD